MKILKITIYTLTIAGIIVFLYFKKGELYYLAQIHYPRIILLFLAGIISMSFNALLFKNSAVIFNLYLPFKEWYGLTVTNTMYNYLLPARGGIALRALYLKRKHAFTYPRYISLTAGVYVLNLFVAAFLAAILSVIFLLTDNLNNIIFLYLSIIFFIFITGVVIFLYIFKPEKIPDKNRVLRFMKGAAADLKEFKKNPGKVRNLILISFAFIFSIALRLFIAYHVLDIPVSFIKLVFISSLVAFSMVFSVTPGNIGIKEGIIGLSASLLDISPDQALLGAVIDRIITVIMVFGLGLVFSRLLLKDLDTKRCESNRKPAQE